MSIEVQALERFFAAINRNDMQAVIADFDPQIVRIEPEGFPTAGTYRGISEVQAHVTTGRQTWAEGSCTPEKFLVHGNRVVVYLHAWVRLNGSTDWVGGRFADGFEFRHGKIIQYLSFGERRDALKWAGLEDIGSPGGTPYPIGTPGLPWDVADRARWLSGQRVQRSYADEVLAPLQTRLPAQAELFQYGVLDYTPLGWGRYPLYAVRSRRWDAGRPVVLVTGGVHGYETSGVQGALRWILQAFDGHAAANNLLVLPCVSPWGYETINRWNPAALDPNRQFKPDGPAAESALAMACVFANCTRVDVHVDLHETTDTDNSEFGPAKAARDGVPFDRHAIPDGFYLVGDSERPVPGFQRAVIDAVRRVTHIAAADERGCIIGTPLQQPGVINFAKRSLGLCGGMTGATFVTTTEVYPDSPTANPAQCSEAQMAAVNAAIDHLQHEVKAGR